MDFNLYKAKSILVRREDRDWSADVFCTTIDKERDLPPLTLHPYMDTRNLSDCIEVAIADCIKLSVEITADTALGPDVSEGSEVAEETLSWLHKISEEARIHKLVDLTVNVVGSRYVHK